jgi:Fe-S cluster biogenesis protein NfuA
LAVLEQRARKLIDEVVRPLVAADGGQIELVKVIEKRIIVRLSGMCAGCPGRPYTLSGIIEPAARRWLGSDVQVEAENDGLKRPRSTPPLRFKDPSHAVDRRRS